MPTRERARWYAGLLLVMLVVAAAGPAAAARRVQVPDFLLPVHGYVADVYGVDVHRLLQSTEGRWHYAVILGYVIGRHRPLAAADPIQGRMLSELEGSLEAWLRLISEGTGAYPRGFVEAARAARDGRLAITYTGDDVWISRQLDWSSSEQGVFAVIRRYGGFVPLDPPSYFRYIGMTEPQTLLPPTLPEPGGLFAPTLPTPDLHTPNAINPPRTLQRLSARVRSCAVVWGPKGWRAETSIVFEIALPPGVVVTLERGQKNAFELHKDGSGRVVGGAWATSEVRPSLGRLRPPIAEVNRYRVVFPCNDSLGCGGTYQEIHEGFDNQGNRVEVYLECSYSQCRRP